MRCVSHTLWCQNQCFNEAKPLQDVLVGAKTVSVDELWLRLQVRALKARLGASLERSFRATDVVTKKGNPVQVDPDPRLHGSPLRCGGIHSFATAQPCTFGNVFEKTFLALPCFPRGAQLRLSYEGTGAMTARRQLATRRCSSVCRRCSSRCPRRFASSS